MHKILIQANNLDTVIDIFMYLYLHPNSKKEDLADYFDITLRQVDYYINACRYLGLVDDELHTTPLAKDIFQNYPAEITEMVYTLVISDEVMSKVFSRLLMFPNMDHSEYAKNLVKNYFPGYSETVYTRRSDNIIKWCKKIIDYIKHK